MRFIRWCGDGGVHDVELLWISGLVELLRKLYGDGVRLVLRWSGDGTEVQPRYADTLEVVWRWRSCVGAACRWHDCKAGVVNGVERAYS